MTSRVLRMGLCKVKNSLGTLRFETYNNSVYKKPVCKRFCHLPTVNNFSTSSKRWMEDAEAKEQDEDPSEENNELKVPVIDVETSIKYMNSKAYERTYNDAYVWEPYRRNFKGSIPPNKTRKTCIRGGVMATGNPCPICRDEYLVIHPDNTKLIKQFISPQTGQVLSYARTGVCQAQHKKLQIAVEQAKDCGNVEMPVPFRKYDYSLYYPELKKENNQ